jgi:hypothetical protein
MMKEFTIEEDFLPLGFFYEIECAIDAIAIDCLKRKFPNLTEAEYKLMYEENYDLFEQSLFAIRDSSAIHDYCVGTEEIDEATGTWGYYHFEVGDLDKARADLAKEAALIFDEAVNELDE